MVSADELDALAWSNAEKLAAKPPQALRLTKMLLKRGSENVVQETIDVELGIIAERLASDEVRVIVEAFFSGREKAVSNKETMWP